MAVLPGVSVHVSELILYSFFKPWYAGIVHYNLLVARPSVQRSDEELTLETSASESLYGGQFTLSTQLIKPNYLVKEESPLSEGCRLPLGPVFDEYVFCASHDSYPPCFLPC